jgi:hypothetical protein
MDFDVVIKVSDCRELALHALLMRTVNHVVPKPRTFPLILDVVNLPDGNGLLIMERLSSHKSLHSAVFNGDLSQRALPQICKKISEALLHIRKTGEKKRSALKRIMSHRPVNFVDRIREKLEIVIRHEPALNVVLRKSGIVMGKACAPIKDILRRAERFLDATKTTFEPALQHGDPHLGNIMIRRYRFGHGVKLLDPNPFVGVYDPLYDIGKLFHWAEEVGWATIRPERCIGELVVRKSKWKLTAHSQRTSDSERLRRALCKLIDTEVFDRLIATSDRTARQRLPLAIAAAHIGLAAILKEDHERVVRQFVVAHVVKYLALWDEACR